MHVAEHYAYRVRWSAEGAEYVGTVAEFPGLSWLDTDQLAAFIGIRRLVSEALTDMAEDGESPPLPIAERSYSGRFQVRIPPEQHRALALEAVEQGVLLNRLAAMRLGAAASLSR